MKKRWSVSHGRDGFNLELEKIAWWVEPYEHAVALFYTATFHAVCCHLPEWAWRVSLGKPKYDYEFPDEDGKPFLENSLGAWLHSRTTDMETFAWRHGTTKLKSVSIDEETGIFLWNRQEDSWLWDDKDDEDN